MGEEQPPVGQAPPSPSAKHLSSSLDAGMASLNLAKTTEANKEEEQKNEKSVEKAVEGDRQSIDREIKVNEEETKEQPASSTVAPNSSTVQDTGEETVTTSQHTGAMNGALVPGQAPVSLVPGLRCSVEQAEEIMGTEATGLGLGLGMGLGLGLADEARMEDYRCIPVDHAVAVECDEQVLGELDVAGFEEFSRRIYALNENMSSFRRPRKSSDKWGKDLRRGEAWKYLHRGFGQRQGRDMNWKDMGGIPTPLLQINKIIGAILE